MSPASGKAGRRQRFPLWLEFLRVREAASVPTRTSAGWSWDEWSSACRTCWSRRCKTGDGLGPARMGDLAGEGGRCRRPGQTGGM